MQLGDLLEELRENILRDRSSQIDGPSDQLWTDRTLVRYINEAHRRFARMSLTIHDGSSREATYLTLLDSVNTYALHPSVLAVVSAKITGDTADLARAGHAAFSTYSKPDPYFFDPQNLSTMPPGKVLAYSTDEQLSETDGGERSVVTLTTFPIPAAPYLAQPVRLRVVRLPLNDFVLADLTATPEIPEIHHLEMLDWAAYLALRIADHDAGNPQRAAEFRASFEAHAAQAKKDMMRKLFAPAQWGFGRNGFTWAGN